MPELPEVDLKVFLPMMNILQRVLFSPFNVQMVITKRCNLSCSYCDEHDNKSLPISEKKLKEQINKLKELGSFSITFTGGEALLHKDIYKLINYAKKRFFIVCLISNGFLITTEVIKKLNKSKLDLFQISIDGVNPNKITKKVLFYLENKLYLLKKYAQFNVNINSVIGSAPIHEAMEVIKFAKKLRFSSSVGLIHDHNGQIKLDDEERKNYQIINQLNKKPFWDISSHEEKLIKDGSNPFKCRAGSRFLYIDEFGNVSWCSQKKVVFKKPLKNYSYKDLQKQFYTQKKCSNMCTVGCVRRSSFFDQFRKQ